MDEVLVEENLPGGDSHSRPPLQRVSTNTEKRPRDVSEKATEDHTSHAAKKPKRTSTGSNKTSAKNASKKDPFPMAGSYQLTCGNRYQPVDTSNFTFRIHVISAPTYQLWATFDFDGMKGVMRMCPLEAMIKHKATDESENEDSESTPPMGYELLNLEEFEKACDVKKVCSGQTWKEWLMRWRGKEPGQHGKIVGGETRAQGQFNFKLARKTTSIDGMVITFAMIYNGKHLIFNGVKIADKEEEPVPDQVSLLQQWDDLFVWGWENPPELDVMSYSRHYVEPEDSTMGGPAGGLIRAVNRRGPNPGFSKNAKRGIALLSDFATAPGEDTTELKPEVWDVAGLYQVQKAEVTDPNDPTWRHSIDASNFSLRIFLCQENREQIYKRYFPRTDLSSKQLCASFAFGKLQGTMRLCPAKLLDRRVQQNRLFDLEDFESACQLPSTGTCLPGPENKSWKMRYRVINGGLGFDRLVGGEKDEQTSFSFELVNIPYTGGVLHEMRIDFYILYNEERVHIQASRKETPEHQRNQTEREPHVTPAILERSWASLNNPRWKQDCSFNLDGDASLGSRLRKEQQASQMTPFLLPPSIVEGKKDLQAGPEWAWDVTGLWEVTGGDLADALGIDLNEWKERNDFYTPSSIWTQYPPGHPKRKFMGFQIVLPDATHDTIGGRQLWAAMEFGGRCRNGLTGCMRFSPHQPGQHSEMGLEEFEQQCILKDGVWPGPGPYGVHTWNLRWRGMFSCPCQIHDNRHQPQTQVTFVQRQDGSLFMRGTFEFMGRIASFVATKTAWTGPFQPPASTRAFGPKEHVAAHWNSYRPEAYTWKQGRSIGHSLDCMEWQHEGRGL